MPTQTAAGYPTASLQTTPQEHFPIFNPLTTGEEPSLTCSVVANILHAGGQGGKAVNLSQHHSLKNRKKAQSSPAAEQFHRLEQCRRGTPQMAPDPRPLPCSLTVAHSLQPQVSGLRPPGEVMQSLQRIVHLSRDLCCQTPPRGQISCSSLPRCLLC